MNLDEVCDRYEQMVNDNSLTWLRPDEVELPASTLEYVEEFLKGCFDYEIASLRLNGTILIHIKNDQFLHYLHHLPETGRHMWANAGFHSAVDNNEVLAYIMHKHGAFSLDACTDMKQVLAEMLGEEDDSVLPGIGIANRN